MRFLLPFMLLAAGSSVASPTVRLVLPAALSSRILFGAEQLTAALTAAGLEVTREAAGDGPRVVLTAGGLADAKPEGFRLERRAGGALMVTGADDSGVLYGCLELAERVRAHGGLPDELDLADAPGMKLRGACIGMQKTYILPGRKVYEYPYTEELFPFFYDREYWRGYLDMLAAQRMNTLYLWNGHPFASLVRLAEYPYAVEVSDEQFERNVATFRWLADECDRRGIWLVQMFYNILLPQPLAERHGLPTQMNEIHPVAADYTRKVIAEFVRQYPHVGLLVCLGEALQHLESQVTWCTDVILAGVKDGMAAAGLTEEPPVVIRAHATNPAVVMPAALKVYSNLYTMAKFNGESLTTWEPRGVRQQVHLGMARLGSTHVSNVHILANLEPFRYGATEFIRKSVLASRDRLGANGLHLYPLAYWSWPEAPDRVDPPLDQVERDWIWFEAWARCAWNPDVDPAAYREHWLGRLTGKYGSRVAATLILDAYNDSGEVAPRILRRFGLTEGNRQTMALGMTLDQLVNPAAHRPFPELWESQSPPGERLHEYAERAWFGQPHVGETPPQIVTEILEFSARAVAAIDAAAPHVTRERAEFERLRNDIHCIRAMAQDYAAKARAALLVLRYRYSRDVADMEAAERHLAESLGHYRELARLTADTYRFANTMQTSQRRIPVPGGIDGRPAHYHWTQVLPTYEAELAAFRETVAAIRRGEDPLAVRPRLAPLRPVPFTVGEGVETYPVQTGMRVFTDRPWTIQTLAPELHGLTGIRIPHLEASAGRYRPVEFAVDRPVRVLLGYFRSRGAGWLPVPDLETDALAAERHGAEPLLQDALTVDWAPPLDVYELRFPAGRHRLEVRGTGGFLILGIVESP